MRPVDHTRHTTEVRRCGRCGEPSLICVRNFQLRVLGIPTEGWTLEFECRACAAQVTLYPPRQIGVERVFAWLMLPAIFPSLYFFASARDKERAWRDNPVVDGAAAPAPRPEEARVCAECHAAAHRTEIGRRQFRSISLGNRYRYVCSRCAAVFTIHDPLAIAFALVAASLLSIVGVLLVTIPPGSAVGAEASNRWFGVGVLTGAAAFWTAFGLRIRARRKHPRAPA